MHSRAVTLLALFLSSTIGAQEPVAFHRPVFFPDGETLLVMTNRHDGDWELYSVGLDGSGARRLTEHPGWDGYADVSPDGRLIVFDRGDDSRSGVVMMDTDSGDERWLLEGGDEFLGGARFAPDGRSLVFLSEESGNREIYRLWLAESRRERITNTEQNETDAVFSPDGARLAYAVWLDDSRSALETLDLASGAVERICEVDGRLYGVAWATAGDELYFNADSDGDQDIYRVPLATGQPHKLTDNDASDHLPVVSPDGRWVVFTSERGGPEAVYLLSIETGEQRRLDLR